MGYTIGQVMRVAMQSEKRVSRAELRAICDDATDKALDDWELDRMVERVEEHPAYQSLPEEPEPTPSAYGRV